MVDGLDASIRRTQLADRRAAAATTARVRSEQCGVLSHAQLVACGVHPERALAIGLKQVAA